MEVYKLLKILSIALLVLIVLVATLRMFYFSLNKGKTIQTINSQGSSNIIFKDDFDKNNGWYPSYPKEKTQQPRIEFSNGIMIITPKNGSWVYRDLNPSVIILPNSYAKIRVKAETGIGIAFVINNTEWFNFDTDSFYIDGKWHEYEFNLSKYAGCELTSIGFRTDGSGEGSSFWDFIIIYKK